MTQYWGPRYWYFLHTLIESYPETPNKIEKSLYVRMLSLFVRLIPCKLCKIHFITVLSKHPPNMESKEKWREWGFNVHNKVNMRLKKNKLNFIDFEKLYDTINHHYLYDFIVYNQIRAYRDHILFSDFTLLLELMMLIWPCIKCRNSYRYRYKKDNLPQLFLSKIGLEKWLKRYMKVDGLHIKLDKIREQNIKKKNKHKKKQLRILI